MSESGHYTLAASPTRISASVTCWVAPRKSPVMPPARAWKRHPHKTATITDSSSDTKIPCTGKNLPATSKQTAMVANALAMKCVHQADVRQSEGTRILRGRHIGQGSHQPDRRRARQGLSEEKPADGHGPELGQRGNTQKQHEDKRGGAEAANATVLENREQLLAFEGAAERIGRIGQAVLVKCPGDQGECRDGGHRGDHESRALKSGKDEASQKAEHVADDGKPSRRPVHGSLVNRLFAARNAGQERQRRARAGKEGQRGMRHREVVDWCLDWRVLGWSLHKGFHLHEFLWSENALCTSPSFEERPCQAR
jgi:hypothetical protein